jgi:hypothetical protein
VNRIWRILYTYNAEAVRLKRAKRLKDRVENMMVVPDDQMKPNETEKSMERKEGVTVGEEKMPRLDDR